MKEISQFLDQLMDTNAATDNHSLVKRIDFAQRVKEFSVSYFDTDLNLIEWRVVALKGSNAHMDGIIAYPDTDEAISMHDAIGPMTFDNVDPVIAGLMVSLIYSLYAHERDLFSGSTQVSIKLYRNWRDLRDRMIELLEAAIEGSQMASYDQDKGVVMENPFKDLSNSAKQSILDIKHQFNSLIES